MRLPSSFTPPATAIVGRAVALALCGVGVMVVLGALFADPLGLGGAAGIGWKQLIAAIIGLVVALIGLGWLLPGALPAIPTEETDE